MEYKASIDIFRKYFQKRLEQARKTNEKTFQQRHPFITISRLSGAGGTDFPEKLINALNSRDLQRENEWMYFDKEILDIVLEEHNLPKEITRYMPEAKISEFQDVIEQLFGIHPSEHKLIKKISDTILHVSHLGNVVLVGRGSNIITRNCPNAIHLRLIDTFERRAETISKVFKISNVEAIKLTKSEDKSRAAYIKKYFNKDVNNPYLYTLIINFELIKVNDAIDLICDEVIKIRKRMKQNQISTI